MDYTPWIPNKNSAAGKLLGHLGRTWEITGYPCQPDPVIYVEAMFYALPTLILSPIKPSSVDYAVRRIGNRQRRMRSFHWSVYNIAHELPQVEAKGIVRWAVLPIKVGAAALWYFALADAYADFTVNWVSMVYQWQGCQAPGFGYGSCEATPGVYSPGILENSKFDGFVDSGSFIFSSGPTGIDTPAGYDPTVGWTFTWDTVGIPPAQAGDGTVRLVDSASGETLSTAPVLPNADGGFTQTGHYNGAGRPVGAGHSYNLFYGGGGGFINVRSAFMHANGRPGRDAIWPDP
jgi:hypothetical protein